MIKAIIFDCFGVLTADTWREFVATLPTELQPQASDLNHAYDRGHINKPEFLEAIKDLTGKEPQYVDDMLDNETTKNTGLLNYIAGLKPRYKIGLLSNVATDWISAHFLSADENKLFDSMIFSYKIGATKPDKRMFEAICSELEVGLEECVFIDDIERYCDAAQSYGMQAICYHDFAQVKSELEKILADSKD